MAVLVKANRERKREEGRKEKERDRESQTYLKKLSPSLRIVRAFRSPIILGIVPEILFVLTSNSCNAGNAVMLCGRVPLIWFPSSLT